MARKITQHMMTFSARVYFNKDSQNLLGWDGTPRYWCEPLELLEVLEVDGNPKSIDRGFVKDDTTGWFLKNLDNYSKEAAEVDFVKLKFTPPYGFNPSNYENWYQMVTNTVIQESLQQEFDAGTNRLKEAGLSTLIGESLGSEYPYYDTILTDVLTNEINDYDNFDITNKKGCQLKLS